MEDRRGKMEEKIKGQRAWSMAHGVKGMGGWERSRGGWKVETIGRRAHLPMVF
jgi:hypothetical protein